MTKKFCATKRSYIPATISWVALLLALLSFFYLWVAKGFPGSFTVEMPWWAAFGLFALGISGFAYFIYYGFAATCTRYDASSVLSFGLFTAIFYAWYSEKFSAIARFTIPSWFMFLVLVLFVLYLSAMMLVAGFVIGQDTPTVLIIHSRRR